MLVFVVPCRLDLPIHPVRNMSVAGQAFQAILACAVHTFLIAVSFATLLVIICRKSRSATQCIQRFDAKRLHPLVSWDAGCHPCMVTMGFPASHHQESDDAWDANAKVQYRCLGQTHAVAVQRANSPSPRPSASLSACSKNASISSATRLGAREAQLKLTKMLHRIKPGNRGCGPLRNSTEGRGWQEVRQLCKHNIMLKEKKCLSSTQRPDTCLT